MTSTVNSLKAIIGPARSGTTWAGALIDSNPEVVYRFEPFHRLAYTDQRVAYWMKRLKEESVCEADLGEIHALLSHAHPLTDKPPFFLDKSYNQFKFGRKQLWPIARAIPIFQRLYQAAYTPNSSGPLVFKEVTFIKQMRNLLERTSVPVVYIVRHPCATVLSEIEGQKSGKMPTGRQNALQKILNEQDPALAIQFEGKLQQMDAVERTTLLWRLEVESGVRAVRQSSLGMLLTYEQLVEDTYTCAKEIFKHFCLEYTVETERFIDALFNLNPQSRDAQQRTGWGDKYFSVYRNPKKQKDAWKSRISSDDRQKIEAILKDSDAFSYCASIGGWQ